MTQGVVEIIEYRFKEGVDLDAALVAHAKALDGFCGGAPGFVSRSLMHQNGDWLDIIFWRSGADADAAGETWKTSPDCAALEQLIDHESIRMRQMVRVV